MDYLLRETEPKDIPAVIELLKACDLYYEGEDAPEKLLKKLAADKDLMIVAEADGKIVGFVMASYDGWAPIFWHFGVLPEFRNRGIGRMLLQEIEKRLRNRGADELWGLVKTDNEKMLRLLPLLGFKTYSAVHAIGKKL